MYTMPSHCCETLYSLLTSGSLLRKQPQYQPHGYRQYDYAIQDLDEHCVAYWQITDETKITAETVTTATYPLHVDVGSAWGGMPRTSHCVLNVLPKPITITFETEPSVTLQQGNWFVLNSQLLHGAECEPPHTVICIDHGEPHDQYVQRWSDYV